MISHLMRRSGAYVLFSLEPNQKTGLSLLATADGEETPMEQFSTGSTETKAKPGWSESGERYKNTFIGEIRNNNLFDSFRVTEEEAIYDMAKHIVLKYGKERQESVSSKSESEGDPEKNISLKIKGLRIDRRKVDLDLNNCIVTVSAPKDGVTINKSFPKR